MMENSSLHKTLENIEKEAEQDFTLLLSTSPAFFSTAELLEMRGRVRERQDIFTRLQKTNLWFGAIAPSWLLAGFIFGALGWITLATGAFLLFPISILFFLSGVFLLRTWLGTRGNLEHISLLIEMELGRRQQKSGKRDLQ